MAALRRGIGLGLLGPAAAAAALAAQQYLGARVVELEESPVGVADDLQLKFVQVVFRHGARAPLTEDFGAHDLKWDYCQPAYSPVPVEVKGEDGSERPRSRSDERQKKVTFQGGCRMGQLTNMGQLQALQLGGWLRQRYSLDHFAGFLPADYSPQAIKVRSTNISRTLDTVTGVLTGLFPSSRSPILIETCDDTKEWLYPNHRNCQRLQQLMAATKKGLESKRKENEYLSGLEARLREAVKLPKDGEEKKDLRFVAMYDVAKSYKFHTGQVPPHYEMGEDLLKELERVAVEVMKAFVAPDPGSQREMLSLSIGPVVEDLLAGMRSAAAGTGGDAKMQLYSGHDTTLMPLLVALGYKLENWPPFASNLIFETFASKSGRSVVKIYFNGDLLRTVSLDDLEAELGPLVLSTRDYRAKCEAFKQETPQLTGVSNGVD